MRAVSATRWVTVAAALAVTTASPTDSTRAASPPPTARAALKMVEVQAEWHRAEIVGAEGNLAAADEIRSALLARIDGTIAADPLEHDQIGLAQFMLQRLLEAGELCDGPREHPVKYRQGIRGYSDHMIEFDGKDLERSADGKVRALTEAELAAFPTACASLRRAIALATRLAATRRVIPAIATTRLEAATQILVGRASLPPNHADALPGSWRLNEPWTVADLSSAMALPAPTRPLDADVLSWLAAADDWVEGGSWHKPWVPRRSRPFADKTLQAAMLLVRIGHARTEGPLSPPGGNGLQRLERIAAAEAENGKFAEGTKTWIAMLALVDPERAAKEQARIDAEQERCKDRELACARLLPGALREGERIVVQAGSSGCFHQSSHAFEAVKTATGLQLVDGAYEIAVLPARILPTIDADTERWFSSKPDRCGSTSHSWVVIERIAGDRVLARRDQARNFCGEDSVAARCAIGTFASTWGVAEHIQRCSAAEPPTVP